jgi:type VI secretion system protein ImpF
MNQAVSRDRLQPALLDRLLDDDPGSSVEPLEARAVTKQRLRQCVLRDLSWLLNAQAGYGHLDREAFGHVVRSTINFGMPSLSGKLVSALDISDLERAMRDAIVRFEPRILAKSLSVRGTVPKDTRHHNQLVFEITCQLWAQPYPLELLLKTALDLETGMVELRDVDGSAVISGEH